jgi:hypothetical protein
MKATLARSLIALASRTLGDQRQAWAQAMRSELEVAIEDGKPLIFAAGCLVAAARQLPGFPEGRLTIASHALAIGLIVPLGALCLWVGLLGYPYLAFGNVGISGFIAGRSEQIPLLVYGEWGLAPALTLAVLLQAAGQLLLAWFLLERNWSRVAALARLNVATLISFILVTGLLAVIDSSMMLPIAALITETLAILALAWWHDHLPQLSEAVADAGRKPSW